MIPVQTSKTVILGAIAILCMYCSAMNNPPDQKQVSQEFKDYWYAGTAELNRYRLEQSRYGATHQGDAVLIFVTEDFLTDKQVKYEGKGSDQKATSVLKLNFTRKFITGIYPYSMMSSVFTPVTDGKRTLKVNASSQEWCGHTFSQLNLRGGSYLGHLYSYFQEEGDQEFKLDNALLEDEIWTRIRLNPKNLPTGEVNLIPGSQYLRLGHQEFKVEAATATLESTTDPNLSTAPLQKYRIEYRDTPRVLEIVYENEFPYSIVAWEEQTKGPNPTTTKAVRTHMIKEPYWQQNTPADSVLRKELGL